VVLPSGDLVLSAPGIVDQEQTQREESYREMNSYEVALIVRPEVEEEAQQALIEQLSQILTSEGGQVENVETWGRRRLAYSINKVNEGFYYFIQGQFDSTVLPTVDRTMRLSDSIVRHMIVRRDK
jgi:small subunit ribosomal protein S6